MGKRALLIGINRYLVPGADLRGCVNDVRNMKGALTRRFGFQANGIETLTDIAATKKAIKRGIVALLRGAKRGDVLLLHYSGHGSNVPDDDGDEADHRDEILLSGGSRLEGSAARRLAAEGLRWLARGSEPHRGHGCCHSGTNTRELRPPDAPRIERYLPSPWDLVAEESRRLRGAVRTSLVPRKRKPRTKDVVKVDIPEVLITGCRDTQTSADAYIGGSYNGALTYHLVAALDGGNGRLTYRELHARVIERLRDGGFDQVPQLEGRRAAFDRPFLAAVE